LRGFSFAFSLTPPFKNEHLIKAVRITTNNFSTPNDLASCQFLGVNKNSDELDEKLNI
jgi:hypothetical protein